MRFDNIGHGGPLDTGSSDQIAILNADRHSTSCTDHSEISVVRIRRRVAVRKQYRPFGPKGQCSSGPPSWLLLS